MINIYNLNRNNGFANRPSAVDVQGLFKTLCRYQDISFKVFQDIFSEKGITSSVMAPIAASLKEKSWCSFAPYLKVINCFIAQFKAHYVEFNGNEAPASMDFLKPVFCQALDASTSQEAWKVFVDKALLKKHFEDSFKTSHISSSATNRFFKDLEVILDDSKKAKPNREGLVLDVPFLEFFKGMIFSMKERVGEKWRAYQGEQVSSLCRNAFFVDFISRTALDSSSVKSLILS